MLQIENILHEYRRHLLKVRFCYGCRLLKSKDEFYQWKRKKGNNPFSSKPGIKVDGLCQRCMSIKRKKKFKLVEETPKVKTRGAYNK